MKNDDTPLEVRSIELLDPGVDQHGDLVIPALVEGRYHIGGSRGSERVEDKLAMGMGDLQQLEESAHRAVEKLSDAQIAGAENIQ